MYGADVRDVRVLPTVVINHGTPLIHEARACDHALDESILSRMILSELRKTHALVNRHPSHYARMIVVAADCAPPFRGETLLRHRRPLARVGHLFPNEKTKLIAPV